MNENRPKIEQRVTHQLLLALLLLSVALLQTALAPSLWRFRVDWVLLMVVSWTLLHGLVPGLRWAFYGGVSLDLLGALPVGSHLLALLLCVSAVALLMEPLDHDQPLLVLATLLLAALLYGFTLMLVLHLTGHTLPLYQYSLVVVIPTAIINTIAALPTFALLRWLDRRGRPVVATELL